MQQHEKSPMPLGSRSYADMKTGVQEVPVPEFAVKTIEEVIKLLFWM
jgi:hypothetical protein